MSVELIFFFVVAILGGMGGGYYLRILQVNRSIGEELLRKSVEFVSQEVESIAPKTEAGRRFFTALSALNYVQSNLSSARHSLFKRTRPDLPSVKSVELCLIEGIGICGNHVMTFIKIMQALDVPVRDVRVYYESDTGRRHSHVFTEVEWGGEWRMIDSTWGFVPLGPGGPFDVLSFEKLRRGVEHEPLVNAAHPWLVHARLTGAEGLAYQNADLDILYSGQGTIRVPMVDNAHGELSFDLANLPTFVGRAESYDGRIGEIRYSIDLPDIAHSLMIKLRHGASSGAGSLAANNLEKPLEDEIIFEGLSSPVRIEARGDSEIYLASIESITAR